MTDEESYEAAKEKLTSMASNMRDLALLHANQHLIAGTDEIVGIVKKLPISRAGPSLDVIQRALIGFELVRLISFWDHAKPDRNCLPQIKKLVFTEAGKQITHDAYFEHWVQLFPPGTARTMAQKEVLRLTKAGELVDRISKDKRLNSLRHFRDVYVAHQLDLNVQVRPIYGHLSKLLKVTSVLTSAFHQSVNGSSLPFLDQQKIARRSAADFWANFHH